MDQLALEGGAAAAFRLVDATNEYIAGREPWAIARDEARASELDAVLWDASEALRLAAVLLVPIMPASAAEIFAAAACPGRHTRASRRSPTGDGTANATRSARMRCGRGSTHLQEHAVTDRTETNDDSRSRVTDRRPTPRRKRRPDQSRRTPASLAKTRGSRLTIS